MDDIKIHFVSLDTNLPKQIEKYFKIDGITYSIKNIKDCDPADCIVSPGNSFGHMDGGIDAILSNILPKIGKKVRKKIAKYYSGEQPIGTCFIIKTGNDKYPFLAHSPTMVIPKNVEGSLNAYYAFKAVLLSVIKHNRQNEKKIKTILTTTFCTGCGDMKLETSLKQMRYAYDVVKNGIKPTWNNANKHYLRLLDLR